MKRFLTLLIILGTASLLITGCQQAAKPAGSIPQNTVASGIATLAKNSVEIDNALGKAGGMTGFKASAAGISAYAITITRSADGWFTGSDHYTLGVITYDRELNFKVYALNGNEITSPAQLPSYSTSNISRLQTYSTISYTGSAGSYTINFGASKADPLTFTYYPSKAIDGPVYYSGSHDGQNFQITCDYGNLGLSASGYPSGSINWAVYIDSSAVASGSLSFDGTSTATLSFSSGGSGNYLINLSSGTATPAGI